MQLMPPNQRVGLAARLRRRVAERCGVPHSICSSDRSNTVNPRVRLQGVDAVWLSFDPPANKCLCGGYSEQGIT